MPLLSTRESPEPNRHGTRLRTVAALCLAALHGVAIMAQGVPAQPCAIPTEAQHEVDSQQWPQAAEHLRAVAAAQPTCPDMQYLLGYALLRANQPRASLEAYTEAAKLRPPTSEDFVAVASDYILLKAYNDAQRWLQRATQTPPVSPQAWYLLGRTQYHLDHNAGAVASFEQSLKVLPEDPRSEYNLGLAYERLQQPDKAREAYQTAIRWAEARHQLDAQPYLDLAILTRSQGHAEGAVALLQKAAALSPKNPLIFQEMGRALLELNRTDEAITALQQAVELAPDAEPPHFFLGRALRAAGKTAEANEQFAIVQRMAGTQSSNTTPNTDHHP